MMIDEEEDSNNDNKNDVTWMYVTDSTGCPLSKNVLYPKMQNFKKFFYNKDNQIWYFDLFK